MPSITRESMDTQAKAAEVARAIYLMNGPSLLKPVATWGMLRTARVYDVQAYIEFLKALREVVKPDYDDAIAAFDGDVTEIEFFQDQIAVHVYAFVLEAKVSLS